MQLLAYRGARINSKKKVVCVRDRLNNDEPLVNLKKEKNGIIRKGAVKNGGWGVGRKRRRKIRERGRREMDQDKHKRT